MFGGEGGGSVVLDAEDCSAVLIRVTQTDRVILVITSCLKMGVLNWNCILYLAVFGCCVAGLLGISVFFHCCVWEMPWQNLNMNLKGLKKIILTLRKQQTVEILIIRVNEMYYFSSLF